MKQFTIPSTYRSELISSIKNRRKDADKMKKDFTPTLLDLGSVKIFVARHFGFCYGVENAIEIAFKTIDENPGKRIFLLSEMIHNPQVNQDLQNRGVKFLQDSKGNMIIPFEELTADDVVIIPAFGTTLKIEEKLNAIGISTEKYNTTCPFVEKVWNRGDQIGKKNYTVIVHGKPTHEETRATFSHAAKGAPTVVVNDIFETIELGKYIKAEKDPAFFYEQFAGRFSPGFDVSKDFERIGVINQTTMLASDTQAIADYLKNVMINKYALSAGSVEERFADTNDTLCYATNDNQSAMYGLLKEAADLAIVVGGYNSSNTSHLVELCEEKLPTYFINSSEKIISKNNILHFDLHSHEEKMSKHFLPETNPLKILISSGASCPDALVESVIEKIAFFTGNEETFIALKEKMIGEV
jgi:4-hydroxy-3-methylbut-2-en-1-yl diphosphate reductase